MKKKVFLTGSTGLVGSYIVKDLVESGSYIPKILVRPTSDLTILEPFLNSCETVSGDLFNVDLLSESMLDCDYVIHSAAKVSFWNKERKEMYRTNVEGTRNMVNAAIENKPAKFIYLSSVSALGRSKKDTSPITEERKWYKDKANTHYAKSKHLAEMEVWRGIGEGLTAIIFNPSIVLGSGKWNSSSLKLLDDIYHGLRFYPTGSSAFTDARDLARIVRMGLETPLNKERIIVAGANLTYKRFFELLAQFMDINGPDIKISPALSQVALFLEKIRSFFTGRKPILSEESAKVAGLPISYDNSKSRELFDFHYRPIELTIEEVCNAYLQDLQLNRAPSIL